MPSEDDSEYASDTDASTSSRDSIATVKIQDYVAVRKEKPAVAFELRAKEMEQPLHTII